MFKKLICAAALLQLLVTVPAFPQQLTGSISGSVRDPAGAAIPGAPMTLVSAATGAERAIRTNEAGNFVISAVDPGEYRLIVQTPGFKVIEKDHIVLTASERLSVGTFTLEVGEVHERISVTSDVTPVQTASAERSQALTSAQVEGLQTYGRIINSLVGLLPGVVDTVGGAGRSLGGNGITNFNVNGNRNAENNFSVDGMTMTAMGGAPNGEFTVSQDSISEVKVLLSNYQAEYGRLAGSNVVMVTKSGAQQFHGMAEYYVRNEDLNANNFFSNRNGQARPVNRFNTVTYNIGGPVYIPGKFNRDRNKLFFFWNEEYVPQTALSALYTVTVPTALERAGNFSQSSVAANGAVISVIDPTTQKPFSGNIIPASRLDANGQALLKFFPLPNFTNTAISKNAYNYVEQWSYNSPTNLFTLRLDYNIGAKDFIYFSAQPSYNTTTSPNNTVTAPFPAVTNARQTQWKGDGVVHYRHIFSPTLINEFMIGYTGVGGTNTADFTNLQRSTYGFTAGQINSGVNGMNLLPSMSFGGIPNAASLSVDGRYPLSAGRGDYGLGDDISKTAGAHTLKAGFYFERIKVRAGPWGTNFNGNFNFGTNANNPLNTGDAFANAVLGFFNTYTEASARPIWRPYSRGIDWYAQDNWRVTRRLTLDYGVRFSWYEPFWNWDGKVAGFVPGLYNPGQQVQLISPVISGGTRMGINPATGATYPAALIGFIAPGTGNPTNGMVVTSENPSYPRAMVNNMGPVASPRFGFAYDPFGDGKTAIRGGFGVFRNRPLSNTGATNYDSYPIVQAPTVYYGSIATFRQAQGLISPASVTAWELNMKMPMVMNTSLSVQRNIGFGTVVDVGYVGSLGRHLSWSQELNRVPLGTRFNPANADPTQPSVPLPDIFLTPIRGYNSITLNSDAASSNYHSMQATINRRFARGLQFGGAWTWSKAMDWTDTEYGSVNVSAPSFRAWNYGLAGFDRTHVVKINWLYELPKRNWSFVPARAALNGWQLSGVATFQSGAPVGVSFSQVPAVDLTGTPSINARIQVNGNPVLSKDQRTINRVFDTGVFSVPPKGSLGDPSKILLRGPGLNNWDLVLFKKFVIREKLHAQLRSEFFNAFNHTQFSTMGTAAQFNASGVQTNGQFGAYTAAQNPRIVQLAFRLQF